MPQVCTVVNGIRAFYSTIFCQPCVHVPVKCVPGMTWRVLVTHSSISPPSPSPVNLYPIYTYGFAQVSPSSEGKIAERDDKDGTTKPKAENAEEPSGEGQGEKGAGNADGTTLFS